MDRSTVLGGDPGEVVVVQLVVPFAVATPPIPVAVAVPLQFVVDCDAVPGTVYVTWRSLV